MEHSDKILALAKFLEVDPALIENNYSEYFTVNGRTIKRGDSPEKIKKVADDFKSLLSEDMQELVTSCIVSCKSRGGSEEVYKTVSEYLQPMEESAVKRTKQLSRLNFKPPVETKEDVYNRLQKDNLFVVNILYHLVLSQDQYTSGYCESLRRAWLGQPINDTRQDMETYDSEYLVFTDSEADECERNIMESLFDDIVDVPPHLQNYVNKEKWIDDQCGNRGENISGYDGVESRVEFEGTTYYIYRHN